MKKIKKMFSSILATIMSVSMLAAVPVSADIAIPLEKTDVDGHDFYLCRVTYYIDDETGEKVPVYHDMYYDFTSDFGGIYHEYYRRYDYVFVTISDDTVAEELDNVLGEQTDIVWCYAVADNQVVYDYSSETDYEALYDITGVENVELAKGYFSGEFSRNIYAEDELANKYGIDPYDNNLLMSRVTIDDSIELTVETFDSTDYDVKAVIEGYSGDWYVYFEYEGIDSYVDFDNQARKIDGILTSNISFACTESVSESQFAFDTVEKEITSGDVNGDDAVDLYDAIEIAKSLMGTRTFTDSEQLIADFNNDGKTNLYDAIDIAKTLIE